MKRTFQRILAMAAVIILVGMLLLTFYFAVTNSPYFFASMMLAFTLPLLIYAWLFVYRLMHGDEADDQKAQKNEQSDD